MEKHHGSSPHSFPLSALFVLVAACAVVAALITPVIKSIVDGTVGLPEAAGASVTGALVIMLLGGTVGLYHYRRVRGLLWGVLTGGAIGMVAGPIVLAPASAFPSLMSMSACGAVILVLIGAAFRFAQRS